MDYWKEQRGIEETWKAAGEGNACVKKNEDGELKNLCELKWRLVQEKSGSRSVAKGTSESTQLLCTDSPTSSKAW